MKDDHSSYRERLLARVRPERRAEADQFLSQYSHNPNEPIFWFFAQVLEEQALTRSEVENQKRRILALTGPDNWKRILLSRAFVPVVLAAFVFGGMAYLNHLNMTTIKKLSERPAEVAAYAKDTLKALEIANDNAANVNAVADILNVPEITAQWRDGKLDVIVPENSVFIQDYKNQFKRITFMGDLRKILGNFQRIRDNRDLEKPTPP